MIHKVGLLYPWQSHLISAVFEGNKKSPEAVNQAVQAADDKATQFARIAPTHWPNIRFLGVWDTVASLITPPSKFWSSISFEIPPYKRRNPYVWAFRQAAAIDESWRKFRFEPGSRGKTAPEIDADVGDGHAPAYLQFWQLRFD